MRREKGGDGVRNGRDGRAGIQTQRSKELPPLYSVKDELPPQDKEESLRYFAGIFRGRGPIVVEIGSGNGHFLVDYSETHPDKNHIGTEILLGRARKFASKARKRGLRNVAVFHGDTRRFVWEFLYEETVDEFIILFPDPWPKKRHHKHRLLSDRFVRMLKDRLVDGGKVCVATDHEEYRDFIIASFESVDGFESPYSRGWGDYPDEYPRTLFLERFKKEGRPLYFLQWIKKKTDCTRENTTS
ncbi:MAG: tRNA (guanosine(46)-N7)-methyltransferase TrmB [Spirochaetes bacterium]|nr:tRNA (guanosine(46)-N7)-methyltransferase TrmB [Spirochaetota bacterium]